ncbi:kinase-like domain-containing protein [Chaetomium sp. MPI-SDFR-AT-0129]|nr:kinase-like domain-containing protein [Chaetomium sp. MPI-SDFR-AT-0129]
MATVAPTTRRRDAFWNENDSFRIHEDAPSTEDTEMNEEAPQEEDDEDETAEQETESLAEEAQESEESESSEDEAASSNQVQYDMEKLQDAFPGFRQKYRLIKRIGEGTFSTVYKAQDLAYDKYDNSWDLDRDNYDRWAVPPIFGGGGLRKPTYVAIKKIYVTSSPNRILNELELLHDLRGCDSVCPLITAFRSTDQVVAILPYFRHADFRDYFRQMTIPDMAIYFRSLFSALASVHAHHILHRDIKPTNFLYDPNSRRGVLVDFGLAEREGYDSKPCLCHDDPATRKAKLKPLIKPELKKAYPKEDTRPSRRANRAGTRGFRAPEVLFKCTEQSTKIDVWSVGVILLTILSRRFPFFNSADDVEAMIEIATIFGRQRMQHAALLHGCMFETNIPSLGRSGYSFEGIILWSTSRGDSKDNLSSEEKLAIEFLSRCMELDPSKRISAKEALQHDFLRLGLDETSSVGEPSEAGDDDEMDMLKA